MEATSSITDAYEWEGRVLKDREGDKIGKIDAVYFDKQTDRPEWATVNTGLFGNKSNFVPLAGARPFGEDVQVQVTKDQVKDAPSVDVEGDLSEAEEITLFCHYGVGCTTDGSVTATGDGHTTGSRGEVGRDASGPNTDGAMTRFEEEVRVGIAERERGRVRLRKYVVTEQVQQTVPVCREEVRVEREPVTDADVGVATDGPAISEEEQEVVLYGEEVVTEKRAVPKERVWLAKETVVDEQTVSEEVRKERIEAEGEGRR